MIRSRIFGIAVTVVLVIAACAALAQKEHAKAPQGEMGMSPEHMKAMMAYGTPGEQHQKLAHLVGKWKAVNKMWMGPGDPTVSEGTAEYTAMLGGRYFQGHYTATMMGQPFEGFSIDGYDNGTHKYFTIWLDSMGTGTFELTGDCSPDGKTITYTGNMYDPTDGKQVPSRSVVHLVDDNTMTYEMYHSMNGKQMKVMEITYTRM
jgi:hypothetical protein